VIRGLTSQTLPDLLLTIIFLLHAANLYDSPPAPGFLKTIIPALLKLYPDNPAIGSPYDPVGVSKTDRFYGPTNQYKRIASLSGDALFESGM
jgi:hypothetical protein